MLKLLQKIYNSSGASWEYMERESAFIFLHLENQEPCQENIKKTGLYLEWHSFKMSSVSPSCSDFWLLCGMMIMLCRWDLSTNINIILLPFVESQSGIHQYFFFSTSNRFGSLNSVLFLPHLESVPHCVELIWLILTWNTPTWSFWLLWPPLTA